MHETLETIQMKSKKVIDGKIKIYFVLISLFLILSDRETQIIALIAFSILSIHAAGRYYFKLLKIPLFFLATSIFIIIVTVKGNVVFKVWIFEITDKSVRIASETTLRAMAALSALGYLVLTTTIPEIISSFKILPNFLKEILTMTYRTIQVMLDEALVMQRAAESRAGFSGLRNWIRSLSLMAFSLFIKSIRRAEMFEKSMSSRCYIGVFPTLQFENRGVSLVIMLLILFFGGFLL